MNEINIKIPLHKFQTLMHRYVRDSLHDNGTPVLICIHDVKEYWAVLDSHTREKINFCNFIGDTSRMFFCLASSISEFATALAE